MIKAKDLVTKSTQELTVLLKDSQKELFTIRTNVAKQQLKNLRAAKNKRIEIARIQTVLSAKETHS